METRQFNVTGMSCAACSSRVEKAVCALRGVSAAEVNLLEGTMRYSALRKAVPDATPKMLTQQLRELEADGLVSRTVWPVVPPRVDYALTPTGESIKPILTAMYRWGDAYLANRNRKSCCSMKPPADE